MAWSVSYVRSVTDKDFSVTIPMPVSCAVVSPVHSTISVKRPSQKKDISPLSKTKKEIKYVKNASIIGHCAFAQNVSNVPNVAQLVGHLQNFWLTWSLLGANLRVVSILKDGCILPFKFRPPLVRDPMIVSGFANPLRNLYLKEALHALIHKKAVERVTV